MRLFLLFSLIMPLKAQSNAFCFERAVERGIDINDVKHSYRIVYGKKGWSFFIQHCRNEVKARADLVVKQQVIQEEKLRFELIRPRPAARIIPCDNKLVALALLISFFKEEPSVNDGSYEDEDD